MSAVCVVLLVCTCRSSGDPHARIYDFSAGADHSRPRILALPEEQRAENKDVTAAEWHPSGNSLVAGSFKGVIRVWNKDGAAGRLCGVPCCAALCCAVVLCVLVNCGFEA